MTELGALEAKVEALRQVLATLESNIRRDLARLEAKVDRALNHQATLLAGMNGRLQGLEKWRAWVRGALAVLGAVAAAGAALLAVVSRQ